MGYLCGGIGCAGGGIGVGIAGGGRGKGKDDSDKGEETDGRLLVRLNDDDDDGDGVEDRKDGEGKGNKLVKGEDDLFEIVVHRPKDTEKVYLEWSREYIEVWRSKEKGDEAKGVYDAKEIPGDNKVGGKEKGGKHLWVEGVNVTRGGALGAYVKASCPVLGTVEGTSGYCVD